MREHFEFRPRQQDSVNASVGAVRHDHLLGCCGILPDDEGQILSASLDESLRLLLQEMIDLPKLLLCYLIIFCQFHATLHADQFFIGLRFKIHGKPPCHFFDPVSDSKIQCSERVD